jgi:putative ABC transport system permease protein
LVQIRGIEGNFPFYGTIETEPKSAASIYQKQNSALVDATVMLQFGLKAGDSIKIGNVTLPIAGALKSVAGSSSIFSSIAPPVVIPYRFIEASGLVQMGSRLNYVFYFEQPDTDLDLLEKAIDNKLDINDFDLDMHTTTSERLGRRYENFGKFLNLTNLFNLPHPNCIYWFVKWHHWDAFGIGFTTIVPLFTSRFIAFKCSNNIGS